MTIGKSYFEVGMTTYAQKWKIAEYIQAQVSRGVARRKEAAGIVAPHRPKANVGVVLIHQYYQEIIM